MKGSIKTLSKILVFSCIFIFATVFISCNYGFYLFLFDEENVDERSSHMKDINSVKPDFSTQNIALPNNTYSFIVISDSHFGANWGNGDNSLFFNFLSEWINEHEASNPEKIPRFMINLGDTADGGHDSEYKSFVEFENQIRDLIRERLNDNDFDFRIYSILGNHDLYNNGVTGFKKFCFPYASSYYFNLDTDSLDSNPGFSFYFLDSANGTLGSKQLDDFKDKISSDSSPKIVFSHYPIYAGAGNPEALIMRIQNTMERNTILSYCSQYNVKQIIDGHIHYGACFDFVKFREDSIESLRLDYAAIVTVNEQTQQVECEIINF